MKFWIEVYENKADQLCDEFEKEFSSIEEAEVWCHETYNTDTYAFVHPMDCWLYFGRIYKGA